MKSVTPASCVFGAGVETITCVSSGRYLYLLYFLEVGMVLIVAPWTTYWDRNPFIEVLRTLGILLTAPSIRGGVSGTGVVSLCVADTGLSLIVGLTHTV